MPERCCKCVLPATIPSIEFNDTGVCTYCQGYRESVTEYDFEGKDVEFRELIEEQKKRRIERNGEYDVLVPVSGGRDSSYVALKLATDYDAKILAVNYKNPFTSAQALKNITNLSEKLGITVIEFGDTGGIHEKSFKTNMKAWLKHPDLANVSLLCLACQSIYLSIFKVAKQHGIELIVAGANPYEITGFKAESQGVDDLDQHRIRKLIAKYLKKITENLSFIKPINIIPAVKAVLSLYGDAPYLRWRYPNIAKTAYFYYFPYNEEEINTSIERIGWRKADDNPSPWRFDCEVDTVKNYIYLHLVGATEKDDLFSRYIRAGLMSREEALARLEAEGSINPEILERVLGQIDVELSQLDEALERSKKG
jgi:tRNA(Ile)-lysidine synthase TilS/MesJ